MPLHIFNISLRCIPRSKGKCIYVHTCMCMHICSVYTHIPACMYTCIHIHMHTCMHTYIQRKRDRVTERQRERACHSHTWRYRTQDEDQDSSLAEARQPPSRQRGAVRVVQGLAVKPPGGIPERLREHWLRASLQPAWTQPQRQTASPPAEEVLAWLQVWSFWFTCLPFVSLAHDDILTEDRFEYTHTQHEERERKVMSLSQVWEAWQGPSQGGNEEQHPSYHKWGTAPWEGGTSHLPAS